MSDKRKRMETKYCVEHTQHYSIEFPCVLCKIKKLEEQNSKIIQTFKKIIGFHIGINAPLGMKQLIIFLKEILNELQELE